MYVPMQEILLLFVGQLGYLADSEGTYYAEYAQLLQVSTSDSCMTFIIK